MILELHHEGFEKYLLERRDRPGFNLPDGSKIEDGVQYIFKFPNGYGASVVKGPYTYGWRDDLWELAVTYFKECGDYNLVYDSGITDDVAGYLTDEEVREHLQKIKELN